ncbi:Fur family transcriptional regulator [Knoellia sp. CPCC 206435]|uniref:Fur family transcriptional regulator n=1 Tax=Knoellia terrae TaxID=3404797 RepID=UPI003B432520
MSTHSIGTGGAGASGASGASGATRRPTRQRAALAELMATTSEFLSAQELHSKLQAQGASVGLATVYRNLQAMAADGDVDVLRTDDGEAAYRSCSTDSHHHHLVCRECGRTVEVEGPAVETWATEVARQHGFADVTHTIELFGTCTSH